MRLPCDGWRPTPGLVLPGLFTSLACGPEERDHSVANTRSPRRRYALERRNLWKSLARPNNCVYASMALPDQVVRTAVVGAEQ